MFGSGRELTQTPLKGNLLSPRAPVPAPVCSTIGSRRERCPVLTAVPAACLVASGVKLTARWARRWPDEDETEDAIEGAGGGRGRTRY